MLKLPLLVAIIATLFHTSVALAANTVGTVSDVKGAVTITSAGGKEARVLRRDDGIAVDDTISTAEKARVDITFSDQTKISLEEKGELTVDKFVYDPKQPAEGKGVFTILGAAFSYVSGLMDKGRKPDVTLQLETGALGIRGTQLMGAMKGHERWIYLKSGKISAYNAGGAVTLNPGEGTIMKSKQEAPAKPHIWKARELLWIKSQVTGHDIQW
jgi:hypothetical protein